MYFIDYATKANLPEYHLYYGMKQDYLKEELKNIGFTFKDFDIINHRGYDTKAVIRLKKAKIKKSAEAFDIIKKYLLTKEMYNNMDSKEKFYYPTLEGREDDS